MPLNDPPCWHKNIGDDGICLDCGRRAAIKLPELDQIIALRDSIEAEKGILPELDHVPLVERLGTQVAQLRQNIAVLLRNVGDPGVCTGPNCKAAIFWVLHKNGHGTPYTPDGANHFIDCPDRKQFKRRKHA